MLGWLAEQGQLERFLDRSGMSAIELKRRAQDPRLLGAVIAFLLTEETLVSRFCAEQSVAAKDLHAAEHALGEAP